MTTYLDPTPLTPRERDLWEWWLFETAAHGFAPSQKAYGALHSINPCGVRMCLKRLQRKGYARNERWGVWTMLRQPAPPRALSKAEASLVQYVVAKDSALALTRSMRSDPCSRYVHGTNDPCWLMIKNGQDVNMCPACVRNDARSRERFAIREKLGGYARSMYRKARELKGPEDAS